MTAQQYNLPALGRRIAYPAHRESVAARLPDRAERRSIAVDLAPFERYDPILGDFTILYGIDDIHRFDRVQEFASYARLAGRDARASEPQMQ